MSKKKNEERRYYWAYGSNLNVAQMRVRCPRAKKIKKMYARFARLEFRGSADVDIVAGGSELTCPGGLWSITPECEATLDVFEGVTKGTYAKWYFDTEIDGKTERVLFYKKISNGLKPPLEYYYQTIFRGYKNFGLNTNHLKAARKRAMKYNGEKQVKLFVYGTLKRGNGNNHFLDSASYLGHAVSEDCYAMAANYAFPMIWDSPVGNPVRGEIYRINAKILESCDHLEGYPRLYNRNVREFVTDDGAKHEAWIYVIDHREGSGNIKPNGHGELEWEMSR
jgi:gamma-glutamylcyclotransferase (GGCT)/AIG2-like uncharacterized protein YtfP